MNDIFSALAANSGVAGATSGLLAVSVAKAISWTVKALRSYSDHTHKIRQEEFSTVISSYKAIIDRMTEEIDQLKLRVDLLEKENLALKEKLYALAPIAKLHKNGKQVRKRPSVNGVERAKR
jgi:hypothetical protein